MARPNLTCRMRHTTSSATAVTATTCHSSVSGRMPPIPDAPPVGSKLREEHADDLAEAQRQDHHVDAADAQRGRSNDEARDRSRTPASAERDCKRHIGFGQQRADDKRRWP